MQRQRWGGGATLTTRSRSTATVVNHKQWPTYSAAGYLMNPAPVKTSSPSQSGQGHVPGSGNTLHEGHERRRSTLTTSLPIIATIIGPSSTLHHVPNLHVINTNALVQSMKHYMFYKQLIMVTKSPITIRKTKVAISKTYLQLYIYLFRNHITKYHTFQHSTTYEIYWNIILCTLRHSIECSNTKHLKYTFFNC